MDVGIGLPNAVPGATGEQLVEWARRAEARGFTTLGTIDRVVYGNYAPLVALAAAAAVTERIGLMTSVLLGPLRGNPVPLAKQTLSLQALSAGRFSLGIAVGAREDDYELSGIEMGDRGQKLDEMLPRMKEIWDDESVGPNLAGPPRLILGGHADASYRRAAELADGWIAGGAPPDQYAGMVEKLMEAWSAAGREGTPYKGALAYFSLGERAEEDANAYLRDYYAWLGEETAGYIAQSAAKDAGTVRQYIEAFEAAGCDELVIFPSASDPEQVDLLAEALGR
jgi:alkanesulfonate monooxygenase SsuD/methylene tetrahydromethanopterin reductase-like flavin-dependent oxidoreductase (luciferase family)